MPHGRQCDPDFFTQRANELLEKTVIWLTGANVAEALMRLIVAYWLRSLSVLS